MLGVLKKSIYHQYKLKQLRYLMLPDSSCKEP